MMKNSLKQEQLFLGLRHIPQKVLVAGAQLEKPTAFPHTFWLNFWGGRSNGKTR